MYRCSGKIIMSKEMHKASHYAPYDYDSSVITLSSFGTDLNVNIFSINNTL